jgi:NADPH2:quinone reductase
MEAIRFQRKKNFLNDSFFKRGEDRMKAIRVHEFGGTEKMKFEEVPDPEPGSGQVVVDIRAIGVNPVDTYIRSGNYHIKPDLPFTPGHEAAGVVVAVGKDVTAVKKGERVYTSRTITGAYAEKALCPASGVHPVTDQISFEQAAAVNVAYSTAYQALFQRGRALPGETAFIDGASGAVGTAAVQLARNAGMIVIGTGGSEKGRRLVLEQGAHHVLDHSADGYHRKVMEITGGRGADVIVEMLSNVNLAKDLTAVAVDGRIVIVGSRGTIEINPREAMVRRAHIIGMLFSVATESEKRQIQAALAAGLGNGTLRPIVGETFPLAEAARAHARVMEPGSYGKIVLVR